jgi:hypothetical protein
MQVQHLLRRICLILSVFVGSSVFAGEAGRYALILANANYPGKTRDLANPVRDADLMERTLKSLGFTVSKEVNLTRKGMITAVSDFSAQLPVGSVAMVYYAGHGLQVSNQNYLLPVDAEFDDPAQIPFRSLPLQTVLERLASASSTVNVVVLDACRNNPFSATTKGNFRSWTPSPDGLATVMAPRGTLVAYSTAPGELAADGIARNSLYTATLASLLLRPGLPLDQVFKQVGNAVRQKTGNAQQPWYESSLANDVVLQTEVRIASTSTAIEKPVGGLTTTPSSESNQTPHSNRAEGAMGREEWRRRNVELDLRVRSFSPDEIKPTEKRAGRGDVDAMVLLGMVYRAMPNNTRAVYWYERAAAQGDAIAQTELGEMRYFGEGGRKDPKEAQHLFERAAAQGYPGASINLAQLKMKLNPSVETLRELQKQRGYPDPAVLLNLLK